MFIVTLSRYCTLTGTVTVYIRYGNRKRKHLVFFAIALVSWLIFVHLCRVCTWKSGQQLLISSPAQAKVGPNGEFSFFLGPLPHFSHISNVLKQIQERYRCSSLEIWFDLSPLESFKDHHNDVSLLCEYWIPSSHTLHLLIIALFVLII